MQVDVSGDKAMLEKEKETDNIHEFLCLSSIHLCKSPILGLLTIMLSASLLMTPSLGDCSDRCGNLSIPFPFGMSSGCYLDPTFLVVCNTTYEPPKAFLHLLGQAEILRISLDEGNIVLLNYSLEQMDVEKRGSNAPSPSPSLVLIQWPDGKVRCHTVRRYSLRYACRSPHSKCRETSSSRGYSCDCLKGYDGNPYVHDGCKDIDECASATNPCVGKCMNLPGSFKCYCPTGFVGDGRKDGKGCHPDTTRRSASSYILLVVMVFMVIPSIVGMWILRIGKETKQAKERAILDKENGGKLFEEMQATRRVAPRNELVKYTAESMRITTREYVPSMVLHTDGLTTLFNGFFPNGDEVVIKKIPKILSIKHFVEQLMFLSERHPNIVRIKGCCFETPSPLLVYELVEVELVNSLFRNIHNSELAPRFTWQKRIKAASGSAKALAHLHSRKSRPVIVHGKFNSLNVLLDSLDYDAKLFDIAASSLILKENSSSSPPDVYRDPNFASSGELTEKSDVYSFGVVLVELLTGDEAFDPRSEKDVMHLLSLVQEGQLHEMLDRQLITNENDLADMEVVATLAESCLAMDAEQRPSMEEVEAKLDAMQDSFPLSTSSPTIDDQQDMCGEYTGNARNLCRSSSSTLRARSFGK